MVPARHNARGAGQAATTPVYLTVARRSPISSLGGRRADVPRRQWPRSDPGPRFETRISSRCDQREDFGERPTVDMVAGRAMKIPLVQDQAIAARMALIVGADNFDRLFRGVQFDEFDGTVLYVYAADEYRAAEIEETFSLHISTIAAAILKREIPIVMVLPQKLKQDRDV
jgi:hypothetical protein